MKPVFFIFASLLLSSTFAQAEQNCLQGSDDERLTQAQSIIQKLVSANPLPDGKTRLKSLPLINRESNITMQLSKIADEMQCEFTDRGRFETLDETLNSFVENFHQKEAEDLIVDPIHAGFKMAILPTTGPNFIYLETTEDGFVFHTCGKDDKDYTRSKVYPSNQCRTLLTEGMFIPTHQMLHSLNSLQHMRRVFLKVLSQMTMVVTSNLGLSVISPIAAGVGSYMEQDSMARIKRDYTVYKMVSEMIKMAVIENKDDADRIGKPAPDHILTRAVAYTFEDLSGALSDVLTVMIGKDFKELNRLDKSPGNPSLQNLPGLKIQQSVYRVFNQLYQEGKTVPVETPHD